MKNLMLVFCCVVAALLSCKSKTNNDAETQKLGPDVHVGQPLGDQLKDMQNKLKNGDQNNSLDQLPKGPVHFTNPTLTSTDFLKSPTHPHLDKEAEGLTLVGPDDKPIDKIDMKKGIVIYIHGWTPSGDIPHNQFSDPRWFEKFNVFYYRWHRQSFDKGILNSEKIPERSWSNVESTTKKLIAQFNALYDSVGGRNFPNEIRIIGYSLGTFVAVDLAHDSRFYSMLPGVVRRLDLIEPFLFRKTDDRTFVNGCQVYDYANLDKASNNLAEVAAYIPSTAYTSSIGGILSSSVWRIAKNVQMNPKWLAAEGNMETQHTWLLPAYFASFGQVEPTTKSGNKGISAATPTSEIKRNRPDRLIQVGGIDTRTLSDDVYEARSEACPHIQGFQFDNFVNLSQYQSCGHPPVEGTFLNFIKACW